MIGCYLVRLRRDRISESFSLLLRDSGQLGFKRLSEIVSTEYTSIELRANLPDKGLYFSTLFSS